MCDKPQEFDAAVSRAGAQVIERNGQYLRITGLTTIEVGQLARDAGVAVFGLNEERSLNQAFMQATAEKAEIRGEVG